MAASIRQFITFAINNGWWSRIFYNNQFIYSFLLLCLYNQLSLLCEGSPSHQGLHDNLDRLFFAIYQKEKKKSPMAATTLIKTAKS